MEEIDAHYFGVIPAPVRYDKELTTEEKLFYAELTALPMGTKVSEALGYFVRENLCEEDACRKTIKHLFNRRRIDLDPVKDSSGRIVDCVIKVGTLGGM